MVPISLYVHYARPVNGHLYATCDKFVILKTMESMRIHGEP